MPQACSTFLTQPANKPNTLVDFTNACLTCLMLGAKLNKHYRAGSCLLSLSVERNGNRTIASSVASTQAHHRKLSLPRCLRRTSGPALPLTVTATAPPPAPLAGGPPAAACAGGVWCARPVRITCTRLLNLDISVCHKSKGTWSRTHKIAGVVRASRQCS